MKQYLLLGAVLISAIIVMAAAEPVDKVAVNVVPSKGKATVTIPAKAVEVAPGVFSLGTAIDNGKIVEGYAFVHYKNSPAKPTYTCGNGICEAGENAAKCPADCSGTTVSTCYGFLAKGAKWKSVEPYILNPIGGGVSSDAVIAVMELSVGKWENASQKDIVGGLSVTSDNLMADTASPDGKNEVYFGTIDDNNAIAITIVWGNFGGPAKNRVLTEWDMVFDNIDYNWSSSGAPGLMDFENIATHELGHTVGMNDLYTSGCSDQTMYGYASEGETNKRTLESGDVTGVRLLYA